MSYGRPWDSQKKCPLCDASLPSAGEPLEKRLCESCDSHSPYIFKVLLFRESEPKLIFMLARNKYDIRARLRENLEPVFGDDWESLERVVMSCIIKVLPPMEDSWIQVGEEDLSTSPPEWWTCENCEVEFDKTVDPPIGEDNFCCLPCWDDEYDA